MSMKLHLVAAADINNKGLDPFFPHSELGDDGLLAVPSVPTEAPAEIVIPVSVAKSPEPIEVPTDLPVEEAVEVPEEGVKQTSEEEAGDPVDVPVEDKKTPKLHKGKKAQ